MTEPIAKVADYMTPHPYCIEVAQTLQAAHELMRTHLIRHLPVLEDGRLVGMLSQRDLLLIESLPGVDPGSVVVEDAMTEDMFTTTPDADLTKVAKVMATLKVGSVVVVEAGQIVGLLSTVDVLKALAEELEAR